MKLSLASAFVIFLCSTIQASAFQGDCLLVVHGKTYIDGHCKIDMDKDGSFTVNVGDQLRFPRYFAYLNMNGDGTATGSWNEDPMATHADSRLGARMKPQGGCWIGDQTKLCAWKAGTRPR